jgi:hypothetical protein
VKFLNCYFEVIIIIIIININVVILVSISNFFHCFRSAFLKMDSTGSTTRLDQCNL